MLAPPYLADDCVSVTTVAGRRHLRSADRRCLVVPRTKTVLGTCNFAVAGHLVWNSLPANICCERFLHIYLFTYLFEINNRKTRGPLKLFEVHKNKQIHKVYKREKNKSDMKREKIIQSNIDLTNKKYTKNILVLNVQLKL